MRIFISLFLSLFIWGVAQGQDYTQAGDALFNQGNYTDAIVKYRAAIVYDPETQYAKTRITDCEECIKLRNIADYLYSDGNKSGAAKKYREVLAINPKDPVAGARVKEFDSSSNEVKTETGSRQPVPSPPATPPAMTEQIRANINAYKRKASESFEKKEYLMAANSFAKAYDLAAGYGEGLIEVETCFNAGFLFAVAQEYESGCKYLETALKYGYLSSGDIYYYLYHCYTGLNDPGKAKDILQKGLVKYPDNSKIIEGLMAIYTNGNGDPKEIISSVKTALQKDSKNAALWSGLGRLYDKIGEADLAINAFAEAVRLTPNDYSANFNLGLLYVKKGDIDNGVFTKQVYATKAEYDAALNTVNLVYAKAFLWLEKALSLKANDPSSVELLKNLSFRLKDTSSQMMKNYQKYDALFNTLK